MRIASSICGNLGADDLIAFEIVEFLVFDYVKGSRLLFLHQALLAKDISIAHRRFRKHQ